MNKPMTDEDRRREDEINQALARFSRRTSARNPLVAALEGAVKLDPYPACATCPGGFWFFDSELKCFCKVKKDNTWGRGAHPVRACVEREDLLTEPRS